MLKNRILLLFIWGGVSIYFSLGGILFYEIKDKIDNASVIENKVSYEENGVEKVFRNKEVLELYIEAKRINNVFGYTEVISEGLVLVLSAMFLSGLGSVLFVFWRTPPLKAKEQYNYLIGGFFSGFIIWLVLRFTPTLFYETQAEINFKSLFFTCFLVGLFQEKFMKWLSSIFDKIFNYSSETAAEEKEG